MHTILLSSDEHRLSDYSIGPEAKLNLVIRPVGERTGASGTAGSSSSSSSTQGRVWQTVSTILARHFSPADAAKVHEQLIKVYNNCISTSLFQVSKCFDLLLRLETENIKHCRYLTVFPDLLPLVLLV